MKSKLRWCGLKLLFATLIISGDSYAMSTQSSPLAEATYSQEKTGIIVTPDHPNFTIKLISNPTTGYSWFLREYYSPMIEPVRHEFQHGDKKLVGAAGFELWTFHAKPDAFVVPKQTVVRLIYARPWEGQGQVQQVTFRISSMVSSIHKK